MKRHIIILLSLFACAAFASCSQDKLEFRQHGVIEVDETYANADDETAQRFIAQIYASVKFLVMGDWGINFIAVPTVKAGDFWPGGANSNDGTQYQEMMAMIDNKENGAYEDLYKRFYQIIYKCNMIVDKLNDETEERRRVIAEAKAWRAWAMMRLVQLWGNPPLVDHVLDGVNYSFYPANTPSEESWEWIMEQFEEAASVLPSKSGLGGQSAIGGRWTEEACYAYKGQGYMWQNDYTNAKTELAKVINSNKYDLWRRTKTMADYGTNLQHLKANSPDWQDGNADYEYLTLFRAEADFCDEFLLELDIDGDANTIGNTEPYWFRAYMGWRDDQIYYPANASTSDGWGFITPTRAFGLAFSKHDNNSVRRRATIATWSEIYNDFPYTNSDIRGVMLEETGVFSSQGYMRMKYYNFMDDIVESRYQAGDASGNLTNFPLMRYANVLLLYAEAVCESGEGPANISGLQALNMVRNRAGLTDAPSLDMNNEMYGIKAERRFELCLEDIDRYVDLIRWGDYKNFLEDTSDNGVGDYWAKSYASFMGFVNPALRVTDPTDLSNYVINYSPMSGASGWNDRLYRFPYPYAEMLQNPNLVQNEGW